MDATLSSCFQVNKDIEMETVEDDTLLMDLERNVCFSLNPVGREIWEGFSQGHSLEEILTRVVKIFEIDAETARADVRLFTSALLEAKLITELIPELNPELNPRVS